LLRYWSTRQGRLTLIAEGKLDRCGTSVQRLAAHALTVAA
jgi:hypothetical protein